MKELMLGVDPEIGEWYVWRGGNRPVPKGTMCEVQFRPLAEPAQFAAAGDLTWMHHDNAGDIVAFRVEKYPEQFASMIEWKSGMAGRPRPGVWYEWKGGECPVPEGAKCVLMLRCLSAHEVNVSGHNCHWNHIQDSSDIIAFKVESYPDAVSDIGSAFRETWDAILEPLMPATTPRAASIDTRIATLMRQPGFVYVGSPYTHYATGRGEAFSVICRITSHLMAAGVKCFSPIAHSHAVTVNGSGIDGTDAEFWKDQDAPLIDAASALAVITLPGWQTSSGLCHEIAEFERAGKPIEYLEPQAIEEFATRPANDNRGSKTEAA